jgi:type I restriction enzyme M protein
MVLNRAKAHPDEVILINASAQFSKGRPKNYMTAEQLAQTAEAYSDWNDRERVASVATKEQVAASDFNLSPSRYVSGAAANDVLPLEEAVVLLREAEEERNDAEEELRQVLSRLGF